MLCFLIGHTFRRTSTTTLANAGADLLQIKRFGGWKSNTVAERYIDDSVYQKKKTETMIASSLSAFTPQLNKSASPIYTETVPNSNTRKFTYKTPKLCTLSSFSTNKEASSMINIEEPEMRLSQYVIEEEIDVEYLNDIENIQEFSQGCQISGIPNENKEVKNFNPLPNNFHYTFNNCNNVTFNIKN